MLPFPRRLYRSISRREYPGISAKTRGATGAHDIRLKKLNPVSSWLAQKKLIREMEYIAYLGLTDSEQVQYERDFVRANLLRRMCAGLVVFVQFHTMGILLDMVPMQRPSPVHGIHFMVAGMVITWVLWTWPYLWLSCFLVRTQRYLRTSLERELETI